MSFTFGPIQEQWLQNLEQHPERQMTGKLGEKRVDDSYKACCLGELCIIAGLAEFNGRFLVERGTDSYNFLNHTFAQVGLRGSEGQRSDDNKAFNLSRLNDCGTTWPEIAAIVRANPEAYFTKSV